MNPYPKNANERYLVALWVDDFSDSAAPTSCGLCQGTNKLTVRPSGRQAWCICPNGQLCKQAELAAEQ